MELRFGAAAYVGLRDRVGVRAMAMARVRVGMRARIRVRLVLRLTVAGVIGVEASS